MRKYQPLWNALKASKLVAIEAEIELHARILNAVSKEKCKDLGWKVLCSESGLYYKIAYQIEGSKITFTLVATSSIRNL